MKLESLLKTKDTFVSEHIVFVKTKPVGILRPSLIYSIKANHILFNGINGIYRSNNLKADSLWEAIINSGGILFGKSSNAINKIKTLLKSDLSRSVSYLCNIHSNCEEFTLSWDKILKTKFCVLGAGGIGSITCMSLLGAGAKKLTIVDHDIIVKSNLNRQLIYTNNDIGKLKVKVLAREISKRFSHIDLEIKAEKITKDNLSGVISDCNLVIVTVDEPLGISAEVINLCTQTSKTIITAGYSGNRSSIYYNSNMHKLNKKITNKYEFQKLSNAIMPSISFVNIELASIASSLAIISVCDKIKYHTLMNNWCSSDYPRLWE